MSKKHRINEAVSVAKNQQVHRRPNYDERCDPNVTKWLTEDESEYRADQLASSDKFAVLAEPDENWEQLYLLLSSEERRQPVSPAELVTVHPSYVEAYGQRKEDAAYAQHRARKKAERAEATALVRASWHFTDTSRNVRAKEDAA